MGSSSCSMYTEILAKHEQQVKDYFDKEQSDPVNEDETHRDAKTGLVILSHEEYTMRWIVPASEDLIKMGIPHSISYYPHNSEDGEGSELHVRFTTDGTPEVRHYPSDAKGYQPEEILAMIDDGQTLGQLREKMLQRIDEHTPPSWDNQEINAALYKLRS